MQVDLKPELNGQDQDHGAIPKADELRTKTDALKGAARPEDMHIWQMKKIKVTKKGSRNYGY